MNLKEPFEKGFNTIIQMVKVTRCSEGSDGTSLECLRDDGTAFIYGDHGAVGEARSHRLQVKFLLLLHTPKAHA